MVYHVDTFTNVNVVHCTCTMWTSGSENENYCLFAGDRPL